MLRASFRIRTRAAQARFCNFLKMVLSSLFFFHLPIDLNRKMLNLFYLKVQQVDEILPILGFEPRIFGVGSDRSSNWATTTTQNLGKQQIWIRNQKNGRNWKTLEVAKGIQEKPQRDVGNDIFRPPLDWLWAIYQSMSLYSTPTYSKRIVWSPNPSNWLLHHM